MSRSQPSDLLWAFGGASFGILIALGALAWGILQGWDPLWVVPSPEVLTEVRIPEVMSPVEGIPVEGTAWRRWLLIFTTVFVAEMGDKTQLATLLMSAQSASPWGIFLGSAGALVVASGLSVLLGEGLAQVIAPEVLRLVAGVGFVVIGIYVIWDANQEEES